MDLGRSLALAAFALALAAQSALADGSARKPNFLLIVADQMRASALGAMDNPDIWTPHLDALASAGILFTNAIASAPVCSPSRAQILTGRYAYTTGVLHNDIKLPDHETTLAELLRPLGYRTGYIGNGTFRETASPSCLRRIDRGGSTGR